MHSIQLYQVEIDDELPSDWHHQTLITYWTFKACLLQFHLVLISFRLQAWSTTRHTDVKLIKYEQREGTISTSTSNLDQIRSPTSSKKRTTAERNCLIFWCFLFASSKLTSGMASMES